MKVAALFMAFALATTCLSQSLVFCDHGSHFEDLMNDENAYSIFLERRQELNQIADQIKIDLNTSGFGGGGPILNETCFVVPTVFHVISDGPGTVNNIPDAQVLSALNTLNTVFANSGANIQFVLPAGPMGTGALFPWTANQATWSGPGFGGTAALTWERPSISNTELALALATSEKTLSRKFKKQAGCKLSDCKRIAMFKKSVEDYFGPTEKTLVELCYDNGLYDPSHFNKLFRDTTTFSPSTFFDRAKNMGDENQAYIFS